MYTIEEYGNGKIAVVCCNDEECKSFMEECMEAGYWCASATYSEVCVYHSEEYKDGIAYRGGKYCTVDYYREHGIPVVYYSVAREHDENSFDEREFLRMISNE